MGLGKSLVADVGLNDGEDGAVDRHDAGCDRQPLWRRVGDGGEDVRCDHSVERHDNQRERGTAVLVAAEQLLMRHS